MDRGFNDIEGSILSLKCTCWLVLTCVATLVHHQHVGSNADHPAHLTLELPIGEPDRSWWRSIWTGHVIVNASSVFSSPSVLCAPFLHGVIPPDIVPHSLSVLRLWSIWWLIIAAQLDLDGVFWVERVREKKLINLKYSFHTDYGTTMKAGV